MRKISFFIITFFISLEFFAQAPSFTWAKGMGGNGSDIASSIDVDKFGNVYTVGGFKLTADFDPGPGVYTLTPAGGFDTFISKLDAAGNFVWAKRIGNINDDYCNSIALDLSGNIIITGYFYGTMDFDPGPGVFNLTPVGGLYTDIFILKLDNSGNFLWAKQQGGNNSVAGYEVTTDKYNNIINVGTFYGTVDFDPGAGVFNLFTYGDLFISKLDSLGNFIWVKQIGGSTVEDVSVDSQGSIYTIGNIVSGDFDPGVGVYNLSAPSGSFAVFISKLDSLGNFVYAKEIIANNSPSPPKAYSIAIDTSFNAYLTGSFTGITDFDPGPGTFNMTPLGGGDIFVEKLDALGNFAWAKRMGGNAINGGEDMGLGISLDALNNVYTSGSFKSIADFDPGPGVFNLNAGTSRTVFIQELNTNGNFIWAGALATGAFSPYNNGYSIKIDLANNLYVAGNFQVTQDFDPGPGTYTLGAVWLDDAFVTKFCQTPVLSPIIAPAIVCPGSINVFSITPILGATSYSWGLPAGFSGTSTTNTISVITGTTNGIMNVTVTNSCGVATQTLAVSINSVITVSVNSPTICIGKSCNLIGYGAITYSWSTGATSNPISVSPTVTTVYTVTGSGAGCALDTKTTSVTVNTIIPTVSVNSATICFGGNTNLIASGANNYSWCTGAATNSISVILFNSYVYTVTGTTGGCSNTATVNILVKNTPTLTINSSSTICTGKSATLIANGAISYTWNTGATTNSISVTPSITTTYTVTGSNTLACTSTNTTTVYIDPLPSLTITTTNTMICAGQSVTLTAGGATNYTWTPGGTGSPIVITLTTTTNFNINGMDGNGCFNSILFTQNVSPCTVISKSEINNNRITIFPNPTNSQINFAFQNKTENVSVKLINTLGEIILEKINLNSDKFSIDISNQANGIYFLEINTNEVVSRTKIIKN